MLSVPSYHYNDKISMLLAYTQGNEMLSAKPLSRVTESEYFLKLIFCIFPIGTYISSVVRKKNNIFI